MNTDDLFTYTFVKHITHDFAPHLFKSPQDAKTTWDEFQKDFKDCMDKGIHYPPHVSVNKESADFS